MIYQSPVPCGSSDMTNGSEDLNALSILKLLHGGRANGK